MKKVTLSGHQIDALHLLLDKYERSKSYQGTSTVHQRIAISPERAWREYGSDFASVERVRDFEAEMEGLQGLGYIIVQRDRREVIHKLFLVEDRAPEIYEQLERRPLKDIRQDQIAFFREWKEKNIPVVTDLCVEQLDRLESGKKTTLAPGAAGEQRNSATAYGMFRLLELIFANGDELLERELSIKGLGDSKAFERYYRGKVCKALLQYDNPKSMGIRDRIDGVSDAREMERAVLEECGIYANPSYVYLKGKCLVETEDTKLLSGDDPIALSAALIRKIKHVEIRAERIVTVENLTSFHRVHEPNTVYIYLAGYHNLIKQQLLQQIAEQNPDLHWFHFGDIDPDGFYILDHLQMATGIEMTPLYMGVIELQLYKEYCKPLEEQDIVKSQNMQAEGKYVEILSYMQKHNCKLEQEIISLEQQTKTDAQLLRT